MLINCFRLKSLPNQYVYKFQKLVIQFQSEKLFKMKNTLCVFLNDFHFFFAYSFEKPMPFLYEKQKYHYGNDNISYLKVNKTLVC